MKKLYNILKERAEQYDADFHRQKFRSGSLLFMLEGTTYEGEYVEIDFIAKGDNYFTVETIDGKMTESKYTFKKALFATEVDRALEDIKKLDSVVLNQKVFKEDKEYYEV
ncbi:MAG: hypothetical protein ACK5MR_10240 [Cumulibacter sp.]